MQHSREAIVDVFKTVGCLAIILHHLAFYGPMADVVRDAWPSVAAWAVDALNTHGRAAVYGFLVVGGFLAARSLAPDPASCSPTRFPSGIFRTILLRYARVAPAAWVAIVAAILAAAVARSWFIHEATPEPASVAQIIAHLFLLQDILGIDGLSAGLWYVAVDFQLYVLFVLLVNALGGRRAGVDLRAVILLLALLGWALLARFSALDAFGVYFVGAYLLGVLAAWVPSGAAGGLAAARQHMIGWLVLLVPCAVALLSVPRFRTALAVLLAILLVLRPAASILRHRLWRVGSDLSYAAFVIHYPVCLTVNAAVSRWAGANPWINLAGLISAVLLSYAAALMLDRAVAWLALPARLRRWMHASERGSSATLAVSAARS